MLKIEKSQLSESKEEEGSQVIEIDDSINQEYLEDSGRKGLKKDKKNRVIIAASNVCIVNADEDKESKGTLEDKMKEGNVTRREFLQILRE
jgi:hypothetical protein